LDVSDTKIVLKSLESSASNYDLDVALLYPCHGEKGKAKWDKHKKVLAVTLPVKKPTAAELKEMEDKHKLVKEVGETVAAVEALKLEDGKKMCEKTETATPPVPPVRSKKVVKTSTRESFAVDTPLPVNNAAAEQFRKKEKTSPKGKKGEKAAVVETPKREETVKVTGSFTASPKFDGARGGYVFKKGAEGLGYYADGEDGPKNEKKGEERSGKEEVVEEEALPTPPTNDAYEYRQSPKTVTLLLQVPNIDADTVEASFEPTSVGLKFFENGKRHDFFLNLSNPIDPAQSSFDVSTKNLIVILGKAEHGLSWKSVVPEAAKQGGAGKAKQKKADSDKKKKKREADKPKAGEGSQGGNVVYENFSSATIDILADLG